MDPVPGSPLPPGFGAEADVTRWHRWPCRKCGHEGRGFSMSCPDCDALPWPLPAEGEALLETQVIRAGTEIDVRAKGVVRTQLRFSTPTGFLGLLTRRFSGSGEWLGADGHEWLVERIGLLAQAYILRDGANALAAAEAPGLLRELFRGSYRLMYAEQNWRFYRTGLARQGFVLALEDGPEAMRISGTIVDPLRKIELLAELPMAVVVLAAFLSCGLRQGEGEM